MRDILMSLGRILYLLGLARAIIYCQRGRLRGVLYHAVDNNDSSYNRGLRLSVSALTLDRQLAFFSQYYRLAGSGDSDPTSASATLAISFDDGFSSVYHNAWPVLQKYQAPAAVFLVTSAVQQQLLWFNALNWALHEHDATARRILARFMPGPLPASPRDCVIEIQEHSTPATIEALMDALHEALPFDSSHQHYLTPCQIQEMRAAGIAFGFHTVSHYNLINCDTQELARQLDSRALSSLLSDQSLAFPCGYYDAKAIDRAAICGFSPLMGVGLDNTRHGRCPIVDRVEIFHPDEADIFAQLEVAEPVLALFRRWLNRDTGRRPSCS